MSAIPEIRTGRLLMRGPSLPDFEPLAAFWASDRSVHEDGPRDLRGAWEDFATGFGCWVIRGYGAWSVEIADTGAFAGIVGLFHPADYPEPELGWVLTPEAEGHGIAREAGAAARDWAWDAAGLTSLVSYIGPANDRSIRVARSLGGQIDEAAPRPAGDPDCVVLRYPRPEVPA